eukprot:3777610-Alexandrium_andersonii.AAC.1
MSAGVGRAACSGSGTGVSTACLISSALGSRVSPVASSAACAGPPEEADAAPVIRTQEPQEDALSVLVQALLRSRRRTSLAWRASTTAGWPLWKSENQRGSSL